MVMEEKFRFFTEMKLVIKYKARKSPVIKILLKLSLILATWSGHKKW